VLFSQRGATTWAQGPLRRGSLRCTCAPHAALASGGGGLSLERQSPRYADRFRWPESFDLCFLAEHIPRRSVASSRAVVPEESPDEWVG